jgi:hypothetical protein
MLDITKSHGFEAIEVSYRQNMWAHYPDPPLDDEETRSVTAAALGRGKGALARHVDRCSDRPTQPWKWFPDRRCWRVEGCSIRLAIR